MTEPTDPGIVLRDGILKLLEDHLSSDATTNKMLATAQLDLRSKDTLIQSLRDKIAQLTDAAPLFGMNFAADPKNSNESLFGNRTIQVARIFLQGLKGKVWSKIPEVIRATARGIKVYVVSWKDTVLDNLKAFLATIPEGITVYLCFHHEPEDDANNAAWRKSWDDQSPIMRTYCAAVPIPTSILMAYTLDPKSGRKPAQWALPKGLVDVHGFDAYLSNYTPTYQWDHITAFCRTYGTNRTLIGETGSDAGDAKRPAKLADFRAQAIERDKATDFDIDAVIGWSAKDTKGWDGRFDAAALDNLLDKAA